jgi:hypothetical protein
MARAAPTANRAQFIPDALALAREGAISLLIDTPWSDPNYVHKRTRDGDMAEENALELAVKG